jgi:hypothetical protein
MLDTNVGRAEGVDLPTRPGAEAKKINSKLVSRGPVDPASGIQFYFDPPRFEIRDHMRKHVGGDPVPVVFITACTGHHIPRGYSSTLIVMRAKLKRLVTEKARFKMLGIWHRYLLPVGAITRQRSASSA